jgi:hypothetical protein
MQDIDILQHIIDTGECPPDQCENCPLNHKDSLSCVSMALGENEPLPSRETINDLYRKMAIDELSRIMIERCLKEDL